MLTHKRLTDLLFYNPQTDTFTWSVTRGPSPAGSIAGHFVADGIVKITIDGKAYRASRLAHFYLTGEWPTATPIKVSKWSRNAASGFRGVSKHPSGRWQATISINGKNKHLGYFNTAQDASDAYQAARGEKA